MNIKCVEDLSSEELNELRESLFDQPDSEEIFDNDINNITDEILFEHYKDCTFASTDFACNISRF